MRVLTRTIVIVIVPIRVDDPYKKWCMLNVMTPIELNFHPYGIEAKESKQ